MKGDKLLIEEGHVRAARQLVEVFLPRIKETPAKFVIAIAAESGGGKSEIATVISKSLSEKGIESIILCQDDYFVYPPKTNAAMRRQDIDTVGLSEPLTQGSVGRPLPRDRSPSTEHILTLPGEAAKQGQALEAERGDRFAPDLPDRLRAEPKQTVAF